MAESNDEQRVACNPDVLAKAVGSETVLVNLRTNRIYELNRTAARLWTLLDEGSTPADVEDALAREFSVDREALRLEIEALVEELLDEELLVRR